MIKIDILCPVCPRCVKIEAAIKKALKLLETQNISEIAATITRVTDFKQFSKYSVNVAKIPIVVINGTVEFAGCVPELELIQKKLLSIILGR